MSVPVLLAILYFLLFSWIIWRGAWFQLDGIPRTAVLGGFYLKVFFGFLFWAVYALHYSVDHDSDAFAYFAEGAHLNSVFYENPKHFFRLLLANNPTDPELLDHIAAMDRWNRSVSYGVLNDNPTIIKFNALVYFFSQGFYHTHTLFMAFVCFSGLVMICRFLIHFTNGLPPLALYAAVLLPLSLLFWGSGVLKEGLLIFGLGLVLLSLIRMDQKKLLRSLLLLLPAIWFLLFTKAYVLIAFGPALLFAAIVITTSKRWLIPKFIGLHVLLFAFVFSLGYWVNDYDVLHMFQLKQQDFYNLAQLNEPGSLIAIPPIRNTADLILNAPTALFNTYFRPHILEASSATYLVSALENLIYLLLIGWSIFKFRKPDQKNAAMALFCLSCVLGLGLLIGLITPILGAVVRYKIPALPFLVVGCFVLMQPWIAQLKFPKHYLRNQKH